MRKYILGIVSLIVFLGFTTQGQAAPTKKQFTVVIDAGHGGHDPGAMSKTIKEKDINLKTALVLGGLIERNCPEVKVIYTRKTDVFVELHRRAQIANQAKADLFISIHTNAVPKGNIVHGAETYTLGMARAEENLEVAKRENEAILLESNYKTTYKGFNPNSSESYIIFEYMQDANMTQSVNFAKKVQSQFKNRAGRIDKGVKQAGFLVLRETSMPSVLIELGYISTPDEAEFLISDKGSYTMGESIYQAFLSYRKARSNVTDPTFAMPTTEPAEKEDFTVAPVETVTAPVGEPEQQEVKPQEEKPQKTIAERLERKNQQPASKTETAKKAETEKADAKKAETQKTDAKKAENTKPETKKAETAKADTKKPETSKDGTKKAEAAKAETKKAETKKAPSNAPVFMIQIMTSDHKVSTSESQFKGLKNVNIIKDGKLYKYTYGSSTNYNEMLKTKKEISAKFKDCFIIAQKNGVTMDVNEAIKIFKANKQK